MRYVVSVRPLNDFCLEVAFDDGTQGVIDVASELYGPVFEPLRERALFAKVFVDEFGAVCWPNGADLAPDTMYEQLRAASIANADASL